MPDPRRRALGPFLASLLLVLLATSCGGDDGRTKVVVYTSIYQEVLPALDEALAEALPDIEVVWHSAGSERIAAQVAAELSAGEIGADLLMTSDPFWYTELAARGALLAYPESEALASWPAEWKDDAGNFCIVRLPVMVMATHEDVDESSLPRSFAELREERFHDRVTMGNPLESGSNFTTVVALERRYGWDYFSDLRRGEIVSAGGNGSVISRLETRQHDVGIVLLENLLRRAAVGDSPLRPVYPEDGAVPIPSPMAIVASTEVPDAARRVYDFMLSEAGQRAIVEGWMYSPRPGIEPPAGAPPLAEVLGGEKGWDAAQLREVADRRPDIKQRFSEIVLE